MASYSRAASTEKMASIIWEEPVRTPDPESQRDVQLKKLWELTRSVDPKTLTVEKLHIKASYLSAQGNQHTARIEKLHSTILNRILPKLLLGIRDIRGIRAETLIKECLQETPTSLLGIKLNALAREYVSRGEFGIVKVILQCTSDLSAYDLEEGKVSNEALCCVIGDRYIHEETEEAKRRVVEILLELGANPNGKDSCGKTPLHKAIFLGYPKIVDLLIANGAVPDSNAVVDTIVKYQEFKKYKGVWGDETVFQIVKVLLEAGAKPDGLHAAVKLGYYPKLIPLMLAHEVDVNARDGMGRTALHLACASGYPECVEFLIGVGANPTILANDGSSPLHEAARKGCEESSRLLLAHSKIEVNAQDFEG